MRVPQPALKSERDLPVGAIARNCQIRRRGHYMCRCRNHWGARFPAVGSQFLTSGVPMRSSNSMSDRREGGRHRRLRRRRGGFGSASAGFGGRNPTGSATPSIRQRGRSNCTSAGEARSRASTSGSVSRWRSCEAPAAAAGLSPVNQPTWPGRRGGRGDGMGRGGGHAAD